MRILSLSTAEQGGSLAVSDGAELIAESYWSTSKSHSKRLLFMIEQMLEAEAGISVYEVDGFIAARGPGSFTGLRIGIGMVKGMAYGTSRPLAGVSSLDGIGYRFAHASMPVCVMMDARRQEVYTSVYHFERGRLIKKSPERVCSPEKAAVQVQGPALYVGSGARVYQGRISEITDGNACFGPRDMEGVSAAALVRPALDDPDFFTKSENRLVPVYLRKSDAEVHFSK